MTTTAAVPSDAACREWLLELMGDHDFTIPTCAFDELVEALSARELAAQPVEVRGG